MKRLTCISATLDEDLISVLVWVFRSRVSDTSLMSFWNSVPVAMTVPSVSSWFEADLTIILALLATPCFLFTEMNLLTMPRPLTSALWQMMTSEGQNWKSARSPSVRDLYCYWRISFARTELGDVITFTWKMPTIIIIIMPTKIIIIQMQMSEVYRAHSLVAGSGDRL